MPEQTHLEFYINSFQSFKSFQTYMLLALRGGYNPADCPIFTCSILCLPSCCLSYKLNPMPIKIEAMHFAVDLAEGYILCFLEQSTVSLENISCQPAGKVKKQTAEPPTPPQPPPPPPPPDPPKLPSPPKAAEEAKSPSRKPSAPPPLQLPPPKLPPIPLRQGKNPEV